MAGHFVTVTWNERVTYTAKIRKSDMELALAASKNPNGSGIMVALERLVGDAEIIDGDGLENIRFHDEDGAYLGGVS